MKKILSILMAVLLIMAMTVPAFAVTPDLGVPDVPEIPDISDDIHFELPASFWDNWFKEHPINWRPVVKIDPENMPEIKIDPDLISACLARME